MQRFLERNHDVRFDIAAALSTRGTLTEPAKRRSSPAAAEERFEEIAEARATEFKFNATVVAAPLTKSAAWLLRSPARRRLKSSRLVPIGPELIVLLSLFRIAQDFVGLVD